MAPFPNDAANTNNDKSDGESEAAAEVDKKQEKGIELSLAFANRSATLFQLNLFEDCLLDVEHAIEFGYPSNQLHTLMLRKALCLKALEQHAEARDALGETLELMDQETENHISALNGSDNNGTQSVAEDKAASKGSETNSYRKFIEASFESFDAKPAERPEDIYYRKYGALKNPTAKLPAANEWVKLCYSPSKGRHLRTKRAVGRDETVIIERPFACTLNPQFFDSYCQNCCIELGKRLYPCRKCSYVAFCSRKCADAAWPAFHEKECQFMGCLQAAGVLRLSLRILLVAGTRNALDAAKQFEANQSANAKERKVTNDYKSVLALCEHSDELPYLVAARQTLAAAYLTYVASEQLKVIEATDADYYKFGGLVLRHIHQISVNSIVMFNQPIVPGPHDIVGIDIKNQVIGTAVYPTVALVNHSCVWNTEQFYIGSTMYLKTRQPLESGEEITFSYGPVYKKMSRNERMDTLKNQYYFRCDCSACNDEVQPDIDVNNFQPILTEAFYCKCRGPLLINSNSEGKCIKCGEGADAGLVQEYMERVDAAKKVMNVGKALIQFGRYQEAEKQYLRALNNLSKICYPEHRLLLAANTELVYVYIFMEKIENARKYCDECCRIKKLSYGEESSEYLHGQLQSLCLRWTQQKKFDANVKNASTQSRTTSMNKRLVSKLIQESEQAVNHVKETVRKSATSAGLVLLDASLVSCLKELVELERHVKAYSS